MKKCVTIIEDFVALQEDLPLLYDSDEDFHSVKTWLLHLHDNGYNPSSMQKMLLYIQALKERKRYAEAAQLLLVSAATEDPVALHYLAYELYVGKLFKQNKARAFTIFLKLAEENFPKALCNIAHFYKHGIVVPKDKKRAKTYYEQAVSLGFKCPNANSLFSAVVSKFFKH